MLKIKILMALIFAGFALYGQGIHFEKLSSWEEVKSKAKNEQKLIFVDCTASWCVPCKEMERDVYSVEEIGDSVNANFVSIKIQMDRNESDDPMAKSWYSDVGKIADKFDVKTYPTYLFFLPNGRLINRGTGKMTKSEFLALCRKTKDYEQVQGDSSIKERMDRAVALNDTEIIEMLSKAYIKDYLMKLPDSQLFTRANLFFIGAHLSSDNKEAISIFYPNAEKAIKIMKYPNADKWAIQNMVVKEIINPELYINGKPPLAKSARPNWEKLHDIIESSYGKEYAVYILYQPKFIWYESLKDYDALANTIIKHYSYIGAKQADMLFLNNACYEIIFKNVDNKRILGMAADFLIKSIRAKGLESKDPNLLDTYASLLYKSGKIKQALYWQNKSVEIESSLSGTNGQKVESEFAAKLRKMERKEATWKD